VTPEADDASTAVAVVVRRAQPDDVPVIVDLVRALAAYERAADEVHLDDEQLVKSLFGEDPRVFAHVAEHRGAVVGFAIWFVNYSTWTGHHGIYLEDLFVRPSDRGVGAGRALLRELAREAVARGYPRLEWAVLRWNEPAIGFYRHLGARPQDDWTVFRLSGPDLARAGGGVDGVNDVSTTEVRESYLQE
jgi:GNAT superfamily N-acetyltransferase